MYRQTKKYKVEREKLARLREAKNQKRGLIMSITTGLLIYASISLVIIIGAAWLIKTGDPSEYPRDEHEPD